MKKPGSDIAFIIMSAALFAAAPPAFAEEGDILGSKTDKLGEQKVISFALSGYSQDGNRKWDIHGDSADVGSDVIVVDKIKANSYDADMNTTLTAERGRFSKSDKNVTLENNVTVVTSDGIKLTTDRLEWLSKTNEITTESFVVVEKDDLYASGEGALADIDARTVRVRRDVFVKQGDLTVTCKGPLEIEYVGNVASFYNDVRVTEPRGTLSADRLDVYFDTESRRITKIVAENNVVLSRDGNVARGQKAVYTVADGRAVMTGSPTITITSDGDIKGAFAGD